MECCHHHQLGMSLSRLLSDSSVLFLTSIRDISSLLVKGIPNGILSSSIMLSTKFNYYK